MIGSKSEYLIIFLLLVFAMIVQSTLLRYVAILGVRPDLVLIIIVYVAYRRGGMVGQISGFFGGLAEDLVSLSPLGFNALIKTIIGNFFGVLEGKMFVDPLIMPFVLVLIATVLKLILAGLFSIVFSVSSLIQPFVGKTFLIEMLYNSILAPFIFALLSTIKSLGSREKEII